MTEQNTTEAAVTRRDQFNIEFDASLSLDDITAIAISDNEENLLLEKEVLEGDLAGAQQKHAKLEEKLKDKAQGLGKKIKASQTAKALAKALNDFHNSKHRFVVEVQEKNFAVVIAKKLVSGEISVVDSSEGPSTYNRFKRSTTEEVPFTDAVDKIVAEIEASAKGVKKINDDLNQIRRKLADLPRLQRRCRAEVAKAHLRGDLVDTHGNLKRDELLAVVERQQPKALPDRR
jgi:F0F1-type ATP synthase membrane subunit b/b'